MFAVAIIELATSAEEEASVLASIVHASAYDLRVRLAGLMPAVVLTTPERDEAAAVLHGVRQRGHGAVGCDLRALIPSTAMVPMRHFVLEDGGMRSDRESAEVLPYSRIHALLHAAHPELHRVIGHEMVFVSPRRGVARMETITNEHAAPQSLYIFRNDEETPWIMREHEARYDAVGTVAGPVQHQNFLAAIHALRARAPHAHFDDRLALHPRSPAHFTRGFGPHDIEASPWADHGADLAAHLLALWFALKAPGPYRS
ncbi:MAG: hypothetical protein M3O46_22785 [Myxococcota bacterium]|nr:hypothetical protein [Myxococcota bacterium]